MQRGWLAFALVATLVFGGVPSASAGPDGDAICIDEDDKGNPQVSVGQCGGGVLTAGYDPQRQVIFVCANTQCVEIPVNVITELPRDRLCGHTGRGILCELLP